MHVVCVHANEGVAAALMVLDDQLMSQKAHGTTATAPPSRLRWGCSSKTADRICCFNRRGAEKSGYFVSGTSFLADVKCGADGEEDGGAAAATGSADGAGKAVEITFYDSVSDKPLFVAPKGRGVADFLDESIAHGWPSFRDDEVVVDSVRVLPDGEVVSLGGTHLGHNIPDAHGNRYCINLVSIAGGAEQASVE